MRRVHLTWFGLWLLGVMILYVCSWPAYESKIPEDRAVVSLSDDGRYLATATSPAKIMRAFSGTTQFGGHQLPRGPIEIWDARTGTAIHTIESGSDIVSKVHLLDEGEIIVAELHRELGIDPYVVSWIKGSRQSVTKLGSGRLLLHCAEVDGTAIAVVSVRNEAKVLDLRTGNELAQFSLIAPWGTVLSQDGRGVVAMNGNDDGYRFRVLDTLTGSQVGSIVEPDYPWAWTLSADGETLWIVVKNQDANEASLHGWDIESQQPRTSITPRDDSLLQAMLRSARELQCLTPSCFRLESSAYPLRHCLFKVDTESIDILDEDTGGDLFTQDGSLQIAMEDESAGEYSLIVTRMEDRSEVFRRPGLGFLEGVSPDVRYLVMQKPRKSSLLAIRHRISGLLHKPPYTGEHSVREIHAIDLRKGISHLVGVLPRHHFRHFPNDGFIDGGKRILINNYIWEFPGHRPWEMILLLPTIAVVGLFWMLKRLRFARKRPIGRHVRS